LDPEVEAMLFERSIDDVLSKIEIHAADLHMRKWESLERLIKKKKIKTVDKEAFHRFYTDTLKTVGTVNLK
jgi:flagellar motor switch protein FliM